MKEILTRAEGIINWVTDFGAVLGGALTGVMTLIVTYAVVMRYFLNRPIGWSEEISIYLMIWAVFLGAAYTLKENAHIGVDLLMSKLPPHLKAYFHLFHYVVGLLFIGVLFFKGVGLVNLSIMLDNRSISIDFPIYAIQLAVPVGAMLLALQMFINLVKLLAHWGERSTMPQG